MLIKETAHFQLHQFAVGGLSTNCYFLVNLNSPEKNKTLIIDPGAEGDFLSEEILRLKLQPAAIWLTHGHFDHLGGILALKLNFNLPIFLPPKDRSLYQNAAHSATHWGAGQDFDPLPPPDFDLSPNLPAADFPPSFPASAWQIIPTPGHTPGSACLYHLPSDLLFTGDTLFAGDIGRTDFSYSSRPEMKKSLQKIFNQVSDSALVLPGHEEISSIEIERLNLPHYLSQL